MQFALIADPGRSVSSPASRGTETLVSNFSGLPKGVGPFDLLNLLKRLQVQLSLPAVSIRHLEYLMSYTRPCDWQAGSRPIVYKTVIGMAHDLGITERQINNRERDLHRLGLLTWTDSGNYRRSGYRDEEGRIVSAYGIDLSPLAEMYDQLVDLADELDRYRLLWDQAKRSLSATKKRLRKRIHEAEALGLDMAELQGRHDSLPRVAAQSTLEEIEAQTDCVNGWILELEAMLPEAVNVHDLYPKTSDRSEVRLPTHTRYKQDTISERNSSPPAELSDTKMPAADAADLLCATGQSPVVGDGNRKRAKSAPQEPSSASAANIKIETLIFAATAEFQVLFREQEAGFRTPWPAFIEAAHQRCAEIGIHSSAWREACGVMGREQAALAVLIIDQNRKHPETPIHSPGGVLRAMTNRARAGELNLLGSLFGIIERKNETLQ